MYFTAVENTDIQTDKGRDMVQLEIYDGVADGGVTVTDAISY